MNNEDMADMLQKLSSMMNQSTNQNASDNSNIDISSQSNNTSSSDFQNILSGFQSEYQENSNQQQDNSNFNFDFETIMKIKQIIDAFHSTENSPETNLLLSLKPYLNSNRKQKLDQYIQFLKITKVIESFQTNGGVNNQ